MRVDASQEQVTQWAVATTQPQREPVAVDHLARQGFLPYCPMLRKTVRHARSSYEVMRPLFPGYVFVGLKPQTSQWRTIRSTTGVRSLLCTANVINFLDDDFIQGLKARECDGLIARPAHPYKIGDRVQLSSGPCDGLIAKIVEMDERDRLVVLLDILCRSTKVEVRANQISPV